MRVVSGRVKGDRWPLYSSLLRVIEILFGRGGHSYRRCSHILAEAQE